MEICIFGANGLVGSRIFQLALDEPQITKVRVFDEAPLGLRHPKVVEVLMKPDDLRSWSSEVRGDVVFLALGSTYRPAVDEPMLKTLDYDQQWMIAKVAQLNSVPMAVLISSARRHPESRLFYMRMKPYLEEAISSLNFDRLRIVRPGVLIDPTVEPGTFDKIRIWLAKRLFPFHRFYTLRPVSPGAVALAALRACFDGGERLRIITPEEVFLNAAADDLEL